MENVNILDEIAHWETIELLYQDGIKSGAGSVNPGHCFAIDLSTDVKKLNDLLGSRVDNGCGNDMGLLTHARRITEKISHEVLINHGCSNLYATEVLDMAKCRKSMAEGHIIVIQRLQYLRGFQVEGKTNFVVDISTY